jgi:hypothetical protein
MTKEFQNVQMTNPDATAAATTDFGLRREAKRHAAFGCNRESESGVAAALCHRSPNLCHSGFVILSSLGFRN